MEKKTFENLDTIYLINSMVSMTPGSFWPKREYLREIETIFENTLAYE